MNADGEEKGSDGGKMPRFGKGTRVRFDEPLAKKTTLKVGGSADIWLEAGSEADLRKVLKWCGAAGIPFRVMGGGSNVVVGDLGLRGVTVRLTGAGFRSVVERNGLVAAGAGVPLGRLLAWAQARGSAGFEFLEGIPGTVGGAVVMNAGAWGSEIGGRVVEVECVGMDGRSRTLRPARAGRSGGGLRFEYRGCRGLENMAVTRVVLKPRGRADAAEIGQKQAEIASKRGWWRGLRCAGSVFKNPAGDFAGRLIEKAGLKRTTVGGASVSRLHANVIVTRQGALASDVMALIETMRGEVRDKFGVGLETEVVVMG